MKRRDFVIASSATIAALGLGSLVKASELKIYSGPPDFGPVVDLVAENKKDKVNCVWDTDGDCGGTVSYEGLFGDQINLPVCEAHLNDHMTIIALNNSGIEVEEVINMTLEERHRKVYDLALELGAK